MKKLILLLSMVSTAMVTAAAEPVSVKDRVALSPVAATAWRQIAAALSTSPCGMTLQTHTNTDGTTSIDYSAPNETLHFCQYVRENVSPACVANRSCESYETWSKSNAVLDPRLPHSLFVSLLLERRRTRTRPSVSMSN
ncbi:hypothetical protein [Burkholderia sp. Tr-20390]|uniref:hypothetical protein n=1 Tax=Burkholderia sp. Tr-20390 TaxID=2703904 RepID=UPI00197E788B|nr:hypothetical protein [Burkholderia sp. Tr-20390]MBN3729497.1 hypothetical protein [Burkholderia sp. Tr-20390]